MLWHDVACYFFLLCFRAWSRDTRETRCIVKHLERKRQETPTSTPTGVSGGGSSPRYVWSEFDGGPGRSTQHQHAAHSGEIW